LLLAAHADEAATAAYSFTKPDHIRSRQSDPTTPDAAGKTPALAAIPGGASVVDDAETYKTGTPAVPCRMPWRLATGRLRAAAASVAARGTVSRFRGSGLQARPARRGLLLIAGRCAAFQTWADGSFDFQGTMRAAGGDHVEVSCGGGNAWAATAARNLGELRSILSALPHGAASPAGTFVMMAVAVSVLPPPVMAPFAQDFGAWEWLGQILFAFRAGRYRKATPSRKKISVYSPIWAVRII